VRVLQRAKLGLSENPRVVLDVEVDVGFIRQGIVLDKVHRPVHAAFHQKQQTVFVQRYGEIGVRRPAAVVFDDLGLPPLSVVLTGCAVAPLTVEVLIPQQDRPLAAEAKTRNLPE
jgi:hypothetical protein